MKKKLAALFLITALSIANIISVFAGTLENDGKGFRYKNSDGSYAKNCRVCVNYFALHFDANGYADKTGWDACKGSWKNTKKGKRYVFDDGKIPKGEWLLSDGIYYTFDDNGYVKSERASGAATATNTATAAAATTAAATTQTATTTTQNQATTPATSVSGNGSDEANGTTTEVSAETIKGRTDKDSSIDFSKYVLGDNGLIKLRDNDVVYKGGESSDHYHLSSECPGKNSNAFTYKEAISGKYQPCSKCTVPYIGE